MDMLFTLKKFIGALAMPLPFFLLISVLGVLLLWRSKSARTGRKLVTLGVVALLLVSLSPVSNWLLRPLEAQYPAYDHLPSPGRIPYVVVLGGGGTADAAIPVSAQLNASSVVRLVEGIRIHRRQPGSKLLLSGGGWQNEVSEAAMMRTLAIDLGVNQRHIITEDQSLDTEDQAALIKALIGDKDFVLVTEASHMPRAMRLFAAQGLDPVPAPTAHRVRGEAPFDPRNVLPRAHSLGKTERSMHERIGSLWAMLRGKS